MRSRRNRLGLTGVGLTGQRIKIVCGMSLVSMSSTVSLVAGVMWPSLRVMGEDWFTADLCSVEVSVCALTREPGPLMVSPPRSCTQPACDRIRSAPDWCFTLSGALSESSGDRI
jgi:hypothetical protein